MIRLEARPPNIEGNGEITIRDLVRNALRMRPDRIIVGEVRGAEALDMLQAMNTGHDGSLTTVHANAPRDALARLETMVLMAGFDLPTRAIREQIASALNLIVHVERFRDGSRRISHVTEVVGMEGDIITLQDIYRYDYKAMALVPTGVRPEFVDKLSRTRRHPPRVGCSAARACGSDEASAAAPHPARARRRSAVVSLGDRASTRRCRRTTSRSSSRSTRSGSMRPAIDAAKAAANEFVASMPADVRIGLETFADDVTVLSPPTTDRALLSEQIDVDRRRRRHRALRRRRRRQPALHADRRAQGARAAVGRQGRGQHADARTTPSPPSQGVHVEAISLTTAETDLASLTALGPVTSADDAAGVSAAFARVASLLVEVVEPVADHRRPPGHHGRPGDAAPTDRRRSPPLRRPRPAGRARHRRRRRHRSSVVLWLGALGIFVGLFLLGLLLFPRERVSKARLGIDKPRSVSEMGKRTDVGRRGRPRAARQASRAGHRPGGRRHLDEARRVRRHWSASSPSSPAWSVCCSADRSSACSWRSSVCLGVRVYVRRTKAKRQAAFADQLPDVLQLVTTALRSGYGLTQALESVAEEAEEPARSEFAHVLVESRLGRDLSDSMRALAQRMESKDLEWVVSAIDINRDTGGNLSEILHTVGATIRERRRMARQVRTLTAEGRLSARILTGAAAR